MKTRGREIFLPGKLFDLLCLSLILLLTGQQAAACSWDYLIWQNRAKNSDPYYRFIKDGKAGFIDRTGKIVIQPTLTVYGNYQRGVINGLVSKEFDEYFDLKTGDAVPADEYDLKTGIFEGLAVKEFDGKYGYVNGTESMVIAPNFLYAKDFSDGLAPVIVEGPCVYADLESPCPEAVVFPRGAATGATGACKFNFINREGKLISAKTYLDIKDFAEGLAPVRTGDGWGYINRKGEIVIPAQFDRAESFSDGLALVAKDDLFGFINSMGAFIIEPQLRGAESFADGLAPVGEYGDETADHEFYYIDKSGKPANSGKFFLASRYFKGLAHVMTGITHKVEMNDGERSEVVTRSFAYINNKGKKVFAYTVEDED